MGLLQEIFRTSHYLCPQCERASPCACQSPASEISLNENDDQSEKDQNDTQNSGHYESIDTFEFKPWLKPLEAQIKNALSKNIGDAYDVVDAAISKNPSLTDHIYDQAMIAAQELSESSPSLAAPIAGFLNTLCARHGSPSFSLEPQPEPEFSLTPAAQAPQIGWSPRPSFI